MKIYNYFIDEKMSIWGRTEVEIKANSQSEADQLMIESLKNYNCDSVGSKYLYETAENISLEQNQGEATVELISLDTEELIYSNKINE